MVELRQWVISQRVGNSHIYTCHICDFRGAACELAHTSGGTLRFSIESVRMSVQIPLSRSVVMKKLAFKTGIAVIILWGALGVSPSSADEPSITRTSVGNTGFVL